MSDERREVYECVVHGWVEAVGDEQPVWSAEHQKFVQGIACPVSMGHEGECGFEMTGPITVVALKENS